ncbi:MAG TPA: STELLO glycosyltransferase family protein [Puia sp.]|nr:STELLO glycosyltransferase family protein [Puia sp.]
MQNDKTSIVVTSIFYPNRSLLALAEGAKKNYWKLIIVGDVSSPKDFHLDGADYYNIEEQRSFEWKFAELCPERHYTRKNIGYLIAMANSSSIIVETDDDNVPNPEFWLPRQKSILGNVVTGSGWANVYSLFTAVQIWPRGFPLEEIHTTKDNIFVNKTQKEICCPIQQGLADQNPDVDAIFRMTQMLPIVFEKAGYFQLEKGLWCPFNSQNTTWFKSAFPLLYLPSFCSFRMTDIWRSFVAQRVIWECDWGILFHNSTVRQERNEHDLLKDFEQEVPGYINNNKIKMLLENLALEHGEDQIGNNMLKCYEALIRSSIISDSKELELLEAWLEDIQLFNTNARTDC